MPFGRFFRRQKEPSRPIGPRAWRAYAIGDVHGCLDLLDELLAAIAEDHHRRRPARGLLVFLGDLVDRGPRSAETLERVRTLAMPGFDVVALAGNHEEIMRLALGGDPGPLDAWLRFGGAEAIRSYGLDPDTLAFMAPDEVQRAFTAAIPKLHREFLDDMADTLRFGDYLFVHAGIRPGVPLEDQPVDDLRWIREPFLSDPRDHGFVVVHGHTITTGVDERANRIGVDTGAYQTGRLSALAIDGRERWVLSTGSPVPWGSQNGF